MAASLSKPALLLLLLSLCSLLSLLHGASAAFPPIKKQQVTTTASPVEQHASTTEAPVKRDYKIVVTAVKSKFNPKYFEVNSTLTVKMYNETTAGIYCDAYFKKDSPILTVQNLVYMFEPMSNQWMPVMDQGKVDWCSYIKKEDTVFFVKNILEVSNLNICPGKKGNFYIRFAVVDADSSHFPEVPHDKDWRIDSVWANSKEPVLEASFYASTPSKDLDADDDDDD